MAEEFFRALIAGLSLALAYNPIAAVIGAAVSAALFSGLRQPIERFIWGTSMLAITWLIGDGMRAIARARDVFDGVGVLLGAPSPIWAEYAAIAIWALGALLLGYVLPTWAGAFVGTRVTHGTGWIAAASVAVGVSLAVSVIVSVL